MNKVYLPGPDKVNSIVFYTTSGDDAMSVLRVLGPAEFNGMEVIKGVDQGAIHYERVSEGDIVVLQRDIPRDLDAYEKIIQLARTQNKPVVMDLDDLLFELPEIHPDRITNFFSEALLPMLLAIMEADLVTVATPALRDYLLPYSKNILVFSNYLNDKLWKLIEPSTETPVNQPISIGYMGGHSHKPDIQMVLPVLVKLLNKYPDRIKFKFWGIKPPIELAPFSQVDWYPPQSFDYRPFASYFQTQAADIMIAPLLDTQFNRCKSSIKYLEYSAIGVPGVYSRITPYESIIDEGVDGMLASSPVEWEESLSSLIEDHDLRRDIARNAQKKIRKSWLLSENAHRIKKAYEKAAKINPDPGHHSSTFHGLIKSLTRQVFDNNQNKNQQIIENTRRISVYQAEIDQLNGQIAEQSRQIAEQSRQINQLLEQQALLITRINEAEEEIVSYVLSTSWRITRPFRKISQKIREIKS